MSKLSDSDSELDSILKRLYEDNVSGKLSIVIGETQDADGHKTRDITIYYRFIGAVS